MDHEAIPNPRPFGVQPSTRWQIGVAAGDRAASVLATWARWETVSPGHASVARQRHVTAIRRPSGSLLLRLGRRLRGTANALGGRRRAPRASTS